MIQFPRIGTAASPAKPLRTVQIKQPGPHTSHAQPDEAAPSGKPTRLALYAPSRTQELNPGSVGRHIDLKG